MTVKKPYQVDINFMAPMARTGYGIVAVNLLKALNNLGVNVALFPRGPIDVSSEYHVLIKNSMERQSFYNPSAASIRHAHQLNLAKHVGRGKRIGYTVFELDQFSDSEVHHMKALDKLLTCTQFAKNILIKHGIPEDFIGILPHGVDPELFFFDETTCVSRNQETVFLNIGKFQLRKGHDVLLEAFNLAFEPKDPVRLVVHGINPLMNEDENQSWIRHFKESKMGSRIEISHTLFDNQRELIDLMRSADCGVFPARAEGWNLELLEMMALGKHVIATNYSGHTEFADHDNCRLIPVSKLEKTNMTYANFGKQNAFSREGHWAFIGKDEVEQLVYYLKELHLMKQAGQLETNKAGITTARKYTWENAAKILLQEI